MADATLTETVVCAIQAAPRAEHSPTTRVLVFGRGIVLQRQNATPGHSRPRFADPDNRSGSPLLNEQKIGSVPMSL